MSVRHERDRAGLDPARTDDASGDETRWRSWMLELGQQIRRLRRLVGLSQQELADLADVSQGAVSRLETARGLATPLLIVVKINLALTAELRKFDATVSNAGLCRTHGVPDLLQVPDGGVGSDRVSCSPDPTFEAFVRLFRETSVRHRQGLLAIMRAASGALREKTPVE
jgi:transcriptional regulator with XRE-family HTH domain